MAGKRKSPRVSGPITCNRCGIILVGVFWTATDGAAPRPALGLRCNNCRRIVEVVTRGVAAGGPMLRLAAEKS